MTVLRALRRSKLYTHAFPDVTLKFEPNDLGHAVCDVHSQSAIDRLLAIQPAGFVLYESTANEPGSPLLGRVSSAPLPVAVDCQCPACGEKLTVQPDGSAALTTAEKPADESPYILGSGESLLDLRTLNDEQLQSFAKYNGVKVHHAAKGNKVRDAIVAHLVV